MRRNRPKTLYTLLPVLIASCMTLSCMTTAPISAAQRPMIWANSLEPASNLYQVTDKLYRSEQPDSLSLSKLHKLHIKTVINLRDWHSDHKILGTNDIHLIHIPLKTWAIQDQQIALALMAIDRGNQQGSVLVHCQHGSDRTGLVIAMYRIIYQHWPIEQAKQEMKQGGFGFHPIWVNIDRFFSPQRVQNISQLIAQRSDLEPELQDSPIKP